MLLALFNIVSMLLSLLNIIIITQFVLSLLINFNVVNTHNDFVRGLMRALDIITEPLYRPIRRVLPDLGGIDFSPIVLLLLLRILQELLGGLAREASLSYG